jgi:hypothetical protein
VDDISARWLLQQLLGAWKQELAALDACAGAGDPALVALCRALGSLVAALALSALQSGQLDRLGLDFPLHSVLHRVYTHPHPALESDNEMFNELLKHYQR